MTNGPLSLLAGVHKLAVVAYQGRHLADESFADECIEVRTEDAREMVARLAKEEGLFVGISSGAAAVAALRVASTMAEGVVVTVFPDAGYKYLSDKNLWESSPSAAGKGQG